MFQPIRLLRRLFDKLFPQEPQGCHYINGPETLPPPLTKEQEAQVLENIRQGLPGAREPLITHNLRLVVYIAKKFESPGASVEDLISIGTIGLMKAVNTFQVERNIKLAMSLMDQTVIPSGTEYSFLENVGPVTSGKGYEVAGITGGAGSGIGFWPEHTWGAVGEDVKLVPIANPQCSRELQISLHPQDSARTALVHPFYHYLIHYFDSLFEA